MLIVIVKKVGKVQCLINRKGLRVLPVANESCPKWGNITKLFDSNLTRPDAGVLEVGPRILVTHRSY